MIRIPRWLFAVLVPIVFLGSCSFSMRPTWDFEQRLFSRPLVKDADGKHFPVLVVDSQSRYSVATLGEIAHNRLTLATGEIDEERVNRDLRASISMEGEYKFFRILNRRGDSMHVTVEYPTGHDSILRGWYEIRREEIIPERIFTTGAGYPFLVILGAMVFGLAFVGIFVLVIQSRPRATQ